MFLIPWANALRMQPEHIVLLYINQKAKQMLSEAGIAHFFKIVPADWEEVLHDSYQSRPSNVGERISQFPS